MLAAANSRLSGLEPQSYLTTANRKTPLVKVGSKLVQNNDHAYVGTYVICLANWTNYVLLI